MPVYEFYCSECHTIFNFLSKTVNTEKRPMCPQCGKVTLERHMSVFATPRNRGEEEDSPLPDLDESKMEQAMNVLAAEAEHLDENDPRQAGWHGRGPEPHGKGRGPGGHPGKPPNSCAN